ncbi:MAG: hypothetical protein LBG69_00970 [Zoogloeaceae bacterium]|jgi:hypothetical protein|nr:hypothetical protein [Zoogloeaceae bacterium]
MKICRTIDHALYPRDAIHAADSAYKGCCVAKIFPLDADMTRLELTVLPEYENNARAILLGFLNFALDKAAEMVLQDV